MKIFFYNPKSSSFMNMLKMKHFFPFCLTFMALCLSFTDARAICTAGNQGALQTCINNSSSDPDIYLTADIDITVTLDIRNKTFTLHIGIYNLTNCNLIDANGNSHMSVTDDVIGTIALDNIVAPTYAQLGANGNLRNFFYGVLPLEFQSFDATPTSKGVLLTWLVVQNKTTDFNIERSLDGKVFDNVGSVKVTNPSNAPQYFTFNDEKPAAQTAYYRIKSTDLAGKVLYSKNIAVIVLNKGGKLKVYPNPVSTEGYINLETVDDIRSITISNTLGQVVLTSNVSKINIAHLAKGLYNVTVKTSGDTMTEKFFKQ